MANGTPAINPELLQALLQMGAGGIGSPADIQQPQGSPQAQPGPEQMSQQGQFNPADVQAQLQSGPAPPFSFAPGTGGVGRQLLNALAQGGKAATYVAEDPRERMADQARAQQLWETKQKMNLAAGEFGQREKDRQLQQQQTDIYRQSMLGEQKAKRETTAQTKTADREARLLQAGFDKDGNPLPPDQLPAKVRSQIELNDAAEKLKEAQAELADARAKNLPAQISAAQGNLQMRRAEYQLKLATWQRDTLGEIPANMAPGGAPSAQGGPPAGPGAQPMVVPQGTLTTESGAPTGWKNPSAPTAATKTKAQQADAIIAVGKKLIPEIDKAADKLGPWSGRGQSFEQWFGSIGPQMERLSGLKGSFGALQPGLHQMRGIGPMQALEQQIGVKGFKTNAEAMKAGVQAMIDSAQTMRDAWMQQKDQPQAPQGGTAAPRGGRKGDTLGIL